MNKYITEQGDTWDNIAFKLWGSEYLFPLLLEANQKHNEIVFFPANIELTVPDIDVDEYTERPAWLEE